MLYASIYSNGFPAWATWCHTFEGEVDLRTVQLLPCLLPHFEDLVLEVGTIHVGLPSSCPF